MHYICRSVGKRICTIAMNKGSLFLCFIYFSDGAQAWHMLGKFSARAYTPVLFSFYLFVCLFISDKNLGLVLESISCLSLR